MSNEKFTKGEWEITKAIAIENRIKVKDKKGKQGRVIGDIRSSADAHLIAAAPEMYEMLLEHRQAFDFDGQDNYRIKEIDELLAKARGEQ